MMRSMFLTIPAGEVELQAHLRVPEGELCGAVALCHPHPLYGGTMDNRVVYRAAKSAAGSGFAALRFNFRGVGGSTGTYDQGLGEQRDVSAAIDWMEAEYPQKPLFVLGYSFGAWVGLKVGCRDPRIRGLVGIGLSLDLYDFDYLVDYPGPSLYIIGTRDAFCSGEKLDGLSLRLNRFSKIEKIQDADHFFSGHMEEVEMFIEDFFRRLACISQRSSE
jgi:alpha/beta superfamily hydrolase